METIEDHSPSILFMGVVLLFVYASNTGLLTTWRNIITAPSASLGSISVTPDGSNSGDTGIDKSGGVPPDWGHMPGMGG